MIKFFATIEYLSGQPAALLTLTDQAGEWAGSGRIEVRSGRKSDLYEEAYRQASLSAQAKGGRLERFSVVGDSQANDLERWQTQREICTALRGVGVPRRKANALNVEIGSGLDRCIEKRPEHWPDGTSSIRWIASGGSVLVFGPCSPACPYLP